MVPRLKKAVGPIEVRGRSVLRAPGYSLAELERAGLTAQDAARLGVSLDRARRTHLGCNVIELHALATARRGGGMK
jgi:ribosomal protein L13E